MILLQFKLALYQDKVIANTVMPGVLLEALQAKAIRG
jgi:hypothetical protein